MFTRGTIEYQLVPEGLVQSRNSHLTIILNDESSYSDGSVGRHLNGTESAPGIAFFAQLLGTIY